MVFQERLVFIMVPNPPGIGIPRKCIVNIEIRTRTGADHHIRQISTTTTVVSEGSSPKAGKTVWIRLDRCGRPIAIILPPFYHYHSSSFAKALHY